MNLKSIFFLLLLICIGGCLSLLFGQDISSFSLTQAIYPPHAILNTRLSMDFMAGGIGMEAQNPLLLLPYYLTWVCLNEHPLLAAFLQGIPYGLLIFFIYKIYNYAQNNNSKSLFFIVIFLIAISGQATLNQIGHAESFLWIALLEILALWLIYTSKKNSKKCFFGFFIAAFAAGLHISAIPFCLALFCIFLFMPTHAKTNHLLYCFSIGILGFSIGLFPAAWYCWKTTGSWANMLTALWPIGWPFPPSPFANLQELPSGISEWLFLPFDRLSFAFPKYQLDIRLCGGLLASLILVGKLLWGSTKERNEERKNPLPALFLITYLGWLVAFRDATSSIFLEILGAFLVYQCLYWLTGKVPAICIVAIGAWYIFQPALSHERQGFEHKNFYFSNTPVITPNALVLQVGHISGLIPFLSQEAKYVGGFWFDEADFEIKNQFFVQHYHTLPTGYYSHKFDEEIKQEIANHSGDIFVLCKKDKIVNNKKSWLRYGIVWKDSLDSCQILSTNTPNSKPYLLCRVQKQVL